MQYWRRYVALCQCLLNSGSLLHTCSFPAAPFEHAVHAAEGAVVERAGGIGVVHVLVLQI